MTLNTKLLPSYKYLYEHEWSYEFERLQRARLIMGRFRYGALGALNKKKYDRLTAIEKKLNAYRKTGNDELLVDIANLCICEFVEGEHPNKHFKTLQENDGVGIPGKL
jgi:hypothetical protein